MDVNFDQKERQKGPRGHMSGVVWLWTSTRAIQVGYVYDRSMSENNRRKWLTNQLARKLTGFRQFSTDLDYFSSLMELQKQHDSEDRFPGKLSGISLHAQNSSFEC